MTEEVIELSINETQALRAKLGLPPLREECFIGENRRYVYVIFSDDRI